MLRWGSIALVTLVGLFMLAGCEKGPKRYELWGKITYQGQPVPAGIIYFDPDIAAGADGPQGFASIHDGEYDTRKEGGQGPIGGKYVLRIYGNDGVPQPELAMGKPLFTEVLIPKELPKQDSELNIDVPRQAPK